MKNCSEGFCVTETLFSIALFLICTLSVVGLEFSVFRNGYSGFSGLVDECRGLKLDSNLRKEIQNTRILYYEDESSALDALREKLEGICKENYAEVISVAYRTSEFNRVCALKVSYEFAGQKKVLDENLASGY